MQAYQFQQTVTPSHQIMLVLPPDAPVGEAQITVLFPHTEPHNPPIQHSHPEFSNIAEYLAWHDTQPVSGRSPEDVDRQIREEREGWSD
jgi:hypothetical protein